MYLHDGADVRRPQRLATRAGSSDIAALANSCKGLRRLRDWQWVYRSCWSRRRVTRRPRRRSTATVNAPRRMLPCSSDPDLGGPHRHIRGV